MYTLLVEQGERFPNKRNGTVEACGKGSSPPNETYRELSLLSKSTLSSQHYHPITLEFFQVEKFPCHRNIS